MTRAITIIVLGLLLAAPAQAAEPDCAALAQAVDAMETAAYDSAFTLSAAAMRAEGVAPATMQRIAARVGNPMGLVAGGWDDGRLLDLALAFADAKDAVLAAAGCGE